MTDGHPAEPDDDDEPGTIAGIDARRLAGWIVVAGLVLGVAAAAFLVWETWSANQAVINEQQTAAGADVVPIVDPDDMGGAAPPDPSPPPGPQSQTS
jgi:uncharacterized membrane protein YebE (DUF533 family)